MKTPRFIRDYPYNPDDLEDALLFDTLPISVVRERFFHGNYTNATVRSFLVTLYGDHLTITRGRNGGVHLDFGD